MPTRRELANAVRFLAIDAVEKAKSGHPGAPLGMADMAEALWRNVLRHNPSNPQWPDRDRFVLSNGHASAMLYALLHLTGYELSLDDIRNFRQLGSRTPGHPEYRVTPGVETTSGPLGQGIASAVGMAVAERLLAAQFNRSGHEIVNHRTYVFLGDGCMMEGISHEACSLAGTLKLGRLIALYDANGISIDGQIDGWFDEDVAARFRAYGWHVVDAVDGHDAAALDAALAAAVAEEERPSLIVCRTKIGFGSPKVDSAKSHGSPLGTAEIEATRTALGWTEPPFAIPQEIKAAWDARKAGDALEKDWDARFALYAQAYPELATAFQRRMRGELTEDWQQKLQEYILSASEKKENIATRVASQRVLEVLVPALPELIGGAADLSGSVGTATSASRTIAPDTWEGNYLSYGVREFAMGAMMNGIALHGGFIPYAGTFLIFSDYAKNAIRLSALMELRVIWILTHDSIGVGEDGPTHQPVEQVAALRLTPGVRVWRPCDTIEAAVAWACALEDSAHPSCFSLSRQNLPFMERTPEQVAAIARGAYILRDCAGTPELIFLATGSEVSLAVAAAQTLEAEGCRVRVVSMPCAERFDAQEASYKEEVLPSGVRARVAVEAAAEDWWRKYVGLDGVVVGMHTYGDSAPAAALQDKFGFTVTNVLAQARKLLV